MSVVDESGKKTRQESSVSLEFKFPDEDNYRISELVELLQSKSIRRLPGHFGPPHPPVDFIETTALSIPLAKGGARTISAREYYAASLVERVKYPAAMVVLMEQIARLEDLVSEKGKPAPAASDCPPHTMSPEASHN